jgi:hypothetical protein
MFYELNKQNRVVGVHSEYPDGSVNKVVEANLGDNKLGLFWNGVGFYHEDDPSFYAYQRASEYPSIGDQLDALFHAGVFPSEMATQIQSVKDKYPKV